MLDLQNNLLLRMLRDPSAMADLSLVQWDVLLRQARIEKLHSRLAVKAHQLGFIDQLPPQVHAHMCGALAVTEAHDRAVRWEVDRIDKALCGLDTPVVLLKGAAYVMLDLPNAAGRLTTDVDIMVAKDQLPVVEQALVAAGWQTHKLNDYDQEYYRKWMHELPPLRHRDRHTHIDVHHTILPESGRLHPNAAALLHDAQPLAASHLKVLAPIDMVLHSAAHLFQDGDFEHGLRDVVDLDDILRQFETDDSSFVDRLVERARAIDLIRPTAYMLHFVHKVMNTPIPEAAMRIAREHGPGEPAARIMDRIITRALAPDHPDHPTAKTAFAKWLLYIRSHWLRMPPALLACHLTRKALRRYFEREQPDEPDPTQANP